MNIKSLLLGSAAALAAVSGAQAADAIVAAQPEPVEYVRVCDAFGTGYFYIPGTETCLRVSGYVRFDVQGGAALGLARPALVPADGLTGPGDAWYTHTRFAFRTSTASDTEFGALKTFTEVRFNYDNSLGGINYHQLKFAYIELAGFRVGKDESAFVTYVGYLGNVINDDYLLPAGSYDTQLISYTYQGDNGFSALLSLEDDFGAGRGYMPNIVGGLGYSGGNWSIKAVGAYEDDVQEGAFKVRADATFGMFSAWIMGGWKTDDIVPFYGNWGPLGGGRWAVWGGASVNVTEKIALNGQLSYNDDRDFQANANVAFTVAQGFTITPEVIYARVGSADFRNDRWGGMVRFQRSF